MLFLLFPPYIEKRHHVGKMTKAQETVKQNIETLKNLSAEQYPALADYLKPRAPLRATLLTILDNIKDMRIMMYGYRPCFYVAARQLAKWRGVPKGIKTATHHLNMLCAMGMFQKITQKPKIDKLLNLNKMFMEQSGSKRPFGVYGIVKYNSQNLREIENRCLDLKTAGITAGNISYTMLANNGLIELANRIYYNNDRTAPDRKQREYDRLQDIIDRFITEKGYTTKQEIYGQYRLETGAYKTVDVKVADAELKKVFTNFRAHLNERYQYKPPNRAEIKKFDLKSRDWIYIPRSKEL